MRRKTFSTQFLCRVWRIRFFRILPSYSIRWRCFHITVKCISVSVLASIPPKWSCCLDFCIKNMTSDGQLYQKQQKIVKFPRLSIMSSVQIPSYFLPSLPFFLGLSAFLSMFIAVDCSCFFVFSKQKLIVWWLPAVFCSPQA